MALGNNQGLAYAIKMVRPKGAIEHSPHAVVQCRKLGCSNRWERSASGKVIPEHMQKLLTASGWQFEVYNPHKSRCPDCVAEHNRQRGGESGKVVTILGKDVVVPKTIAPPAPVPNDFPIYSARSAAPPKVEPVLEIREFHLTLRSSRGLPMLAEMLSGFGEITAVQVKAIEQVHEAPRVPEHVQPPAPAVAAAPVVAPDLGPDLGPEELGRTVTAEPGDMRDVPERTTTGRRKLTFSDEAMAKKRASAAIAMAARRAAILGRISELYLGDDTITTAQMIAALNASGLKPIGRGFPGGWQKVQLDGYLTELRIRLDHDLTPSQHVRAALANATRGAPQAHAGGLGDD